MFTPCAVRCTAYKIAVLFFFPSSLAMIIGFSETRPATASAVRSSTAEAFPVSAGIKEIAFATRFFRSFVRSLGRRVCLDLCLAVDDAVRVHLFIFLVPTLSRCCRTRQCAVCRTHRRILSTRLHLPVFRRRRQSGSSSSNSSDCEGRRQMFVTSCDTMLSPVDRRKRFNG